MPQVFNVVNHKVRAYPDGRLNTENAASYLGVKPKTLAMMRCTGEGPRFLKRGRIFYFLEDLDAWLNAAGRYTSTAQARSHAREAECPEGQRTAPIDKARDARRTG